VGDVVEDPRDRTAADDQHDGDEARGLHKSEQNGRGDSLERRRSSGIRLRKRGQQHEHEHHHEVFDDQPADRDVAALGLKQATFLERA
jgi:hypothetical protein